MPSAPHAAEQADRPAPVPAQRELAYEVLREALLLQTLQPGSKLSEPAWVAKLQVSRTAVREAFARLEAEDLIARGPQAGYKAGYIVPELSDEDIEQIREIRFALETAAIDRICARHEATNEDFQALEALCDQQATLIEQGYRLGSAEADQRFHRQLVETAGNPRLTKLYRRAPLPLTQRLLTESSRQPTPRTVAEHRQILAALRTGEAARARALLHAHLFVQESAGP